MPHRRRRRFAQALAVASFAWAAPRAAAQTAGPALDADAALRLDPVVVTAGRTPQPPQHIAPTLRVFTGDALRASPAATVDGILRAMPSFSLFRRGDSLATHPTAQGVSLRGLGPSGASRSLVLLDGIPLNDPFGGWIAWTKIPREAISRAEIVPGGGATAWGNAALGGVMQIFTDPPDPAPGSRTSGRVAVVGGDFRTRSVSGIASVSTGADQAHVSGEAFATRGYPVVAAEDRGPVDVRAWNRHRAGSLRWRRQLSPTLAFTATVRGYEERRGNGTPLQQNDTRESLAAAELAGTPRRGLSWTAAAYVQDQTFSSVFSSVAANRASETPASEQHAVPATAFGGSWTATWQTAEGRTALGADIRAVRGETRELFSFTGGRYSRERVAGGRQQFVGAFATHERRLGRDLLINAGARVDAWRDSAGVRREVDHSSGALLRAEAYPTQRGTPVSPSLGLVWTPLDRLRVRAHAQHSFRRPTLNELYRPFRQGATVTEANPGLKTERARSAELALEWSPRRPAPGMADLTFNAALYWNELRDAVANVTVARGPGIFPLFGSLPAGGTGRQRLNLERTRVQGIELGAVWRPWPLLELEGAYLYNDATVRSASVAPLLVGKRLAQTPAHAAALVAHWRPLPRLTFSPRLRWLGRQFEDDENTLRLGEAVVVDVGATWRARSGLEFFLNVENAANARVETGRSPDGIVNVSLPRFAFGGVRVSW